MARQCLSANKRAPKGSLFVSPSPLHFAPAVLLSTLCAQDSQPLNECVSYAVGVVLVSPPSTQALVCLFVFFCSLVPVLRSCSVPSLPLRKTGLIASFTGLVHCSQVSFTFGCSQSASDFFLCIGAHVDGLCARPQSSTATTHGLPSSEQQRRRRFLCRFWNRLGPLCISRAGSCRVTSSTPITKKMRMPSPPHTTGWTENYFASFKTARKC